MPPGPNFSRRAGWASGQPISDLMHRALAQPHLISLAAGFVDQHSLPAEALGEAFDAVWREADVARAALQYGTTTGHPPLRNRLFEEQLAADGLAARDTPLGPENIVITAGSNQLLHLVSDTLLDPGDLVLCAAPTYFVYLGIVQNLGATAIGVPADDAGLDPAALEATLQRLAADGRLSRVKLIYLCSYFDNPGGVTLTLPRRQALIELLDRWQARQPLLVLEDTAYRELRYSGDDPPSLWSLDRTGERVVLAQTFSKSLAPGLRVGYGILPRALRDAVAAQKGNLDFGSANLNQFVLEAVLQRGLHRPHVDRLREVYREKMHALLEAAERYLAPLPGVTWRRPRGGLYVWAELPPSIETGPSGRLFDEALRAGVLYVPGEYCFPAEGSGQRKHGMRLSFGVQSPERIAEGIRLLAESIQRVMND